MMNSHLQLMNEITDFDRSTLKRTYHPNISHHGIPSIDTEIIKPNGRVSHIAVNPKRKYHLAALYHGHFRQELLQKCRDFHVWYKWIFQDFHIQVKIPGYLMRVLIGKNIPEVIYGMEARKVLGNLNEEQLNWYYNTYVIDCDSCSIKIIKYSKEYDTYFICYSYCDNHYLVSY
jgi:hypothetical protein